MRDLLLTLSRAATSRAGEPRETALREARALFQAADSTTQQATQPIAAHIAASARTWDEDEPLPRTLEAFADRDPDRVRGWWSQLDVEQQRMLAPVGVQARIAADEEARFAAMAADYDGVDHEAAEQIAMSEPAGASSEPARIVTSRTPEDLLADWDLDAFRPGQRDAVQAALDGRDCLVVMPTGGGKSLCYQLPGCATDTVLTVVVSPLIALIADQHQRLLAAGKRSVMFASSLGEDANREALNQVRTGWAQVVFCAPERFASAGFRAALQSRTVGLFVVDEAHCVSEWGHDFRPDYLRLTPMIDMLGRPPVMAATATATPKVADEIVRRLGLREPVMIRRGFDRSNLSFDVISFEGEGAVARKRTVLLDGLRDAANRPAVVYCGTRKDTETLTALLSEQGIETVAYHAGLDQHVRTASQEAFMSGVADVVCATNAFGMGVDKSDIRSVWHWALPTSVEAYYQEAGRAGRDGLPARAVLLAMRADLGRLVKFIKQSEMTVDDVKITLAELRRKTLSGATVIDPRTQNDRERVAVAIAERSAALSLSPADGGMIEVRLDGTLDERAAARVCWEAKNRRWEAYNALKQFAATDDVCRRRQLLDHFGDDEPTAPDGRCCDVCSPVDWVSVPTAAASKRPAAAADHDGPPVDPRALEDLKAWRRDRADGKPAYTVATNRVLEDVLRVMPRDTDQLLAIKGIGPSFIAKHGESLLTQLASSPTALID